MSSQQFYLQQWLNHSASYLQNKVALQQTQLDRQSEEIEHLKIALINVQSVVNGLLQRELL